MGGGVENISDERMRSSRQGGGEDGKLGREHESLSSGGGGVENISDERMRSSHQGGGEI